MKPLQQDSGLSIAELAVTMMIFAVAAVIGLAMFSSTLNGEMVTRDDSDALAQLRFAGERITKELRQARTLDTSSDERTVKFWIDVDRDNQDEPGEWISWSVVDTSGGEAELVRFTDANPTPVVIAADFLTGDAFAYSPDFPGTPTMVTLTLRTDLVAGPAPGERIMETSIRLRNEATP